MDAERREELIRKIIAFEDEIDQHIKEISEYDWDSDVELVILSKSDMENILQKFNAGEISKRQLDEWANFIECRDDMGFEEPRRETLREIIHWLANPDLGYELDANLISKIEEALKTNAL